MAWTVDPERLAKVQGMPRSVSQVKEYLAELGGCAHRYYLGRVVRAWERPAAWSPQGTAVHAAAEAWERSGRTMSREAVRDVFRTVYAEEIEKLTEKTPNWGLWFDSFQGSGDRDVERRYGQGLEQVDAYLDYYEAVPEEVVWVTPDGEPAIELEFNIDLDGVLMRGFIDQVVWVRPPLPDKPRTASGAVSKSRDAQEEWARRIAVWEELAFLLRVRDIKTGRNPGDPFQIGVYIVAIAEQLGIEVPAGDFWMARKGKATAPFTPMTRDRIVELVHKADRGIKAGEFPPNPEEDRCTMCAFRTSCEFSAA